MSANVCIQCGHSWTDLRIVCPDCRRPLDITDEYILDANRDLIVALARWNNASEGGIT